MALIDVTKQFDEIKKAAIAGVRVIFPIERQKHKMILNNVWVEDTSSVNDYKSQAKARARGKSWGSNVYADLSLIDKFSGEVLDRQRKVKLFLLPKLTPRASYIVKGNEYQVANQLRLKSGVYTKRMKGGGVKTQINLAKGGFSAELHVNESGVIRMKVRQAFIDLYPLLIGMGISDNVIRKSWGDQIYNQNVAGVKSSPQIAVKKLSTSVAGNRSQNFETARDNLKVFIDTKTGILPEMTKLTLGKEYDKFSPMLWLDASRKLIETISKRSPVDDVDNLAYKEFFGVDDALKERIEKSKDMLIRKISRNLDSRDKISQIININSFGNIVESFFTSDDRSSTPEQINPLHMYSQHEKITFLGPGSITDVQRVSEEMRNVHPTHLSYLDPVHTPESEKIGLNLGLTMGTTKEGKTLKAPFWNLELGKFQRLAPIEIYEKVVAYPDQWDTKTKKLKGKKIKAQHKGKLVVVPPREVDLVMPFAQHAFTLSTNMIPFMANDNGNRTMMAGKHMEQAISLKYRETPFVQNKLPVGEGTFEQMVGSSYTVYATRDGSTDGEPVEGRVESVTKDYITIKSGRENIKIPLYNNFSLNQKTFLNHEPAVKVGDKVEKNQILADSNYTKNGTLALGKNLKAAYIAYKGYNFEDGIVITETAAQKLTSEHIHKKTHNITDSTVLDLGKYLANFPNNITPSSRDKLDSDGLIKKGSKVVYGDTVIAAMKRTQSRQGIEVVKASFHKSLAKNFRDSAEIWTKEVTGTVTDVVRTSSTVTVYIKTSEPAKIGDKLAGRHGNKGIITKIIQDSDSPMTRDGSPVEILLNPHGIISRINIGQIYESAAGKIALKSGEVYRVSNFSGENYLESIKRELEKSNLSDKEELTDPLTGKVLGNVHVGNPYILKLNKQSDVNFSVRGEVGPVAKTTLQPIKGGEEGSKAIDLLTMYSLLSHGARANLQEMTSLKSENNVEFWEALKYGRHLPAPKIPFVFDKLKHLLQGAGVDVKKDGSRFILKPLIDEQTRKLSKMEIKEPGFFTAKKSKLVTVKGGFVDSKLGGTAGDGWAHIKLKETMVNPIFEEAIKTLTGLVKDDYNKIIIGAQNIDVNGKNLTGNVAIKALLDNVDTKKRMAYLKGQLNTARGTRLNKLIKEYRFLRALRENGLTASQAYMRKYVPVIPPKFRPVSIMESGDIAVDDTNILYRNVALISKQLHLPVVDLLDTEDLVDVNVELYRQMRGLAGLIDIKMAGKDKSGFITQIKGRGQPKEGFYQSKVLRKNQNLVGRGTIIPEPNLHMDEVALPEKMAWKLYGPFVIKALISQGLTAKRATEEIAEKTFLAKIALDRAMKSRPVMLNRAPSLHKFSVMAFTPKITGGKAIKIPPLVVSGFNADFDGDTMTVHVPVGEKAVREAYKMMPSRNLYKPGSGSLMVGPSQESQLGFYLMTKNPQDRATLNRLLPPAFKIRGEMDKRASKKLFMDLSKTLPNEAFSKLIDKIKILGETAAYEKGFSIGIEDLTIIKNRDKYLDMLEVEAAKVRKDPSLMKSFSNKLLGKGGIQEMIDAQIEKDLSKSNNSFYQMINSGARGNLTQLRQIIASPLIVQDTQGGLIPKPISKSFAEGLDLSDYWIASYGARKGMMDRALATQEPGVFNKALMSATMDNIISMEDCGTKNGIMFNITDPNILGRFTQGSQGDIEDKTLVNEEVVRKLKLKKYGKIFVRSPLKCEAYVGTCRLCYGIDENGQVVNIGDNIGAKSAQTLAEPLTQMTLNTFHTGGVAGSGTKGGYTRIQELVHMPKSMREGKATVATVSGVVDKIETSGLGGYNIYLNGKRHTTEPGLKLKVVKQQTVFAGDPLSEGSILPQEMLLYKGMDKTQDYMVNELDNAYKSEGIFIDRKVYETIVRSIADKTKVLNDIPDLDYLPGDTIPFSVALRYNKNRGNKERLRHQPYLTGIKYIPQNKNDWLAQMGASHIKDAIVKGASQGWMSDVKGYHPLPAFAYGADFGEGEDGRY